MKDALIQNIEYLSHRINVHGQPALESCTGVPQTTISGILKQGKIPRMSTLEKIATGLEVELWQLLAPPLLLKASLGDGFAGLIDDYCRSSLDGQQKIELVARGQAIVEAADD